MTVAIDSNDVFDAPQATLSEAAVPENTGLWSKSGRLGILKYFSHSILLMLAFAAILMGIASFTGLFSSGIEAFDPEQMSPLLGIVGLIVLLPFAWLGIVFFIRRLHDFNLTGWFALVTFIPVIGAIFTLVVLVIPGAKEGNKYGAPAKTVFWEKIIGGIGLVVIIATVVAAVVGMVAPALFGLAV